MNLIKFITVIKSYFSEKNQLFAKRLSILSICQQGRQGLNGVDVMKQFTLLALLAIFLIIGLASPALAADITGERTLNTTSVKAGDSFRVTLNVTVSDGTLYAPGIDENLPDNWTVTPVQNDGMIYQAANTQWVLIDEMGPGKKTVIYDVFVPTTTENGTYSIAGEVSAKEWADGEEITRKNNIIGDTNVTIGVPESYKPTPIAAFYANTTNGFVPITVNFTDQSTGTPASWLWDFGDGTNSTEQNPEHTFSEAGNYTVNLVVSNENGTNSTSALIIVSEKSATVLPIANFSSNVTSGTAPLSVQFTDLSENATDWTWDFGDGSSATEQNPVHTYTSAGSYTVNLTVTGPVGSDSEVKTRYIKVTVPSPGKPVAAFSASPASGKTPLTVAFTDTSTGTPTKWKWSFGDGTSSTQQNPKHKYSKAGKYTVTLTVTNAKGSNIVTETDYIKVISKPAANFISSVTSGKAPLNVKFTDTSTGTASSWIWDFGDGSKSFVENPVHKYSKAGTYTVSLTVKNASGRNTVTKTEYIKIITKPVANFTSSVMSGKVPLNVKFTDTSTGTASGWIWDFGDGSRSFVENPTHKYSKAGTYTVNLTVKNASGRNTVTKTDYIKVV
jgi:PKD repeat protein